MQPVKKSTHKTSKQKYPTTTKAKQKPKKNPHCVHFIQYQYTNHAKDIIDIKFWMGFFDSDTFVNIFFS